MTAIVVEHVDKSFGSRQVLHGIDFRIAPGEIVGLLGPNGSGKTTTLRLIAGFYQPDAGRIVIDDGAASSRGPAIRPAIGYLPERAPLYDALSVEQYLQFVGRCKQLTGATLRDDIDRAINAFDLSSVRRSAIGRLSKGFRQRVGLAQAILGNPSVLLLDEATNGLDPMQIVEARRMIRDAARGRAVVFSSHLMQEVQALCTRALMLRHGRLIADVPLDEGQARVGALVELRWRGHCGATTAEQASAAVVAALAGIDGVVDVAIEAATDASGAQRLLIRHASQPEHLDPLLRAALAHGHVLDARVSSTSVEQLLIDAIRDSDAMAHPTASSLL